MITLGRLGQPSGARSARPAAPRQATYLDRGGDLVLQPPFAAQGTRLFSFFFDADRQRLVDYCNRWLNPAAPDGVEYVPAAGLVVLAFAEIASMRSVHAQDSLQGWTPEVDVGFWIPLVRRRRVLGGWIIERVCWTLCYVFVDSVHAAAIGREVWGFPKALGRFEIPAEPADEARFSVETHAIRRFGPGSSPQAEGLLEVRRTDAAELGEPLPLRGACGQAPTLLARAARAGLSAPGLPGFGALLSTLRRFLAGQVPMVFLKQFRDATDPTLACYQEIVEAPAELETFHSGGILPGEYELKIQHLDSFPIQEDLGIRSGTRAFLATELNFDFIMHPAAKSTNSKGAPRA